MAQLERIVISGGGTGGHIHPALAIADEIKRRHPSCDIRFVGAKGRMEMEKVPAAGYSIDGLWISGVDRNWKSTRNLSFPFKLISSLWAAGRLIRKYRPQVAVGVGGFASGPLLFRAARKGIPTLIQEQNSFPGITNRILAGHVQRICAGFPGLDRWFPADRIILTGNPLRQGVVDRVLQPGGAREAREALGLDPDRPVLFVMGGSLGAASMNEAVQALVEGQPERTYQILWQCGARYADACEAWAAGREGLVCRGFIERMDLAYVAADVIASRAGAMSLAELALVGKPAVLVPSPYVAEDHQTSNARSLSDRGGAVLLEDRFVVEELGRVVGDLFAAPERAEAMRAALTEAARPDAALRVVDEIEALIDGAARG